MFAKDIVHFEIKPITAQTTLVGAKELFYINKVNELPIIDLQGAYIGLLKEEDIEKYYKLTNEELRLSTVIPLKILPEQHIYEVFELLTKHSLTLVPLVSADNKYLGSITTGSLVTYLVSITGLRQKGAVLIITQNKIEYSLTQICQIIESNGAKIISLCTNETDNNEIEITLKINLEEITSIIQSLDRYNYRTKTLNAQTEALDVFFKSRIDNLMTFLNV